MPRRRKQEDENPTDPPAKRPDLSDHQNTPALQENSSSQNNPTRQSDLPSQNRPALQNNHTLQRSSALHDSFAQEEGARPPVPLKLIRFQQTFEQIENFGEGMGRIFIKSDDDFGLQWSLIVCREDGYFGMIVGNAQNFGKYILNFDINIKVSGNFVRQIDGVWRENVPFVGVSVAKFIKWEDVHRILVNGSLVVSVEILIIKTVDVDGSPLKNFNEPIGRNSDGILVVENQKFHISKTLLANHSNFFKILFFGEFKEANKSEVTLHGHDPRDVQNVLRIMYLEPALNESTVEGILHFAEYCQAESVKKMCEMFLLEESKKSFKKKMEMFLNYKLNWRELVYQMESKTDVKSVLPEDIDSLDDDVAIELLAKLASLC